MATVPNFRTALNGFHRVDVVQFIQTQTAEHERELRCLREENARLQEALDAAQKELTEAKTAAEALLAEAEARAAQEDLAAEEEAVSEEAPGLDAPIAPAATVVEASPADYNELELAAYRRAEMTERLARERAAASSKRMQSVFAQADEKLNLTAQDLLTMMDAFRNDFDQMQQLLKTAQGIFRESSAGIKAASDLCCEP